MHRLTQNDVTNRINVESVAAVEDAVCGLFGQRFPDLELAGLRRAFHDAARLFAGTFSGYLGCDTPYHDFRHTLDVALAMARLIDGHERSKPPHERIGKRRALLGMVVALFHDSGYMRRTDESSVVSGAIFTAVHVSRGAQFLTTYLPSIGLDDMVPLAEQLIHFTGYEQALSSLRYGDARDQAVGCMLGAADLIAQMSDRTYLEKCREFLFAEFVHGGLNRRVGKNGALEIVYATPTELLEKTPAFFDQAVNERIEKGLDAAHHLAEIHFGGVNLYRDAMNTNRRFLDQALARTLEDLKRRPYSVLSDRHPGYGENGESS